LVFVESLPLRCYASALQKANSSVDLEDRRIRHYDAVWHQWPVTSSIRWQLQGIEY